MSTRSNDLPSAPAVSGRQGPTPDESEDLLNKILGGRYSVEINIDGIVDGVSGEWEPISTHDTLGDSIRACSAFVGLTKQCIGAGPLDNRSDAEIEPWIRVMDLWSQEKAIWVENGALFVAEEEE
jgi:hypothetical protein